MTRTKALAAVHFITWHRAFIRSTATHARIPGNDWGDTFTRAEAQRDLTRLVDQAINRRGGLVLPRKAQPEYQIAYWRDQHALRGRARIYRFETLAVARRFRDRLASRTDD